MGRSGLAFWSGQWGRTYLHCMGEWGKAVRKEGGWKEEKERLAPNKDQDFQARWIAQGSGQGAAAGRALVG